MSGPTERQLEVVDAIRKFIAANGYPPTVRELCAAIGVTSPSTMHAHLRACERRGMLRSDPRKPRTLMPTEPGPDPLRVAEQALIDLHVLIRHELDGDPSKHWSDYHATPAAQELVERLQREHEGAAS